MFAGRRDEGVAVTWVGLRCTEMIQCVMKGGSVRCGVEGVMEELGCGRKGEATGSSKIK